MTISLHKTLILSCSISLLAACGGGGSGSSSSVEYSGSTSAAVATEDNKSALVEASVLGAKQALSSSALPRAATVEKNDALNLANQTIFDLLQVNSLPIAAQTDISAELCISGSATAEGDQYNSTIRFSNCVISEGLTMDGTAVTTSKDDGSFVIVYKNFTMTLVDETFTLNATLSCDAQFTCTVSSDFVAVNGSTYRISDTSSTGDSTSGYSINATVFDSELGRVNFTSSNMLFECENGYPSAGSLVITDAQDNVINVTIENCNSYTVTFNGNGELLDW